MTLNQSLMTIRFFFVLLSLIKHTKSFVNSDKEDIVKEIVTTLNSINEKNVQLKSLVETLVKIDPGQENKRSSCQCVPFDLCNNGSVIKDGSNMIQPRTGINPCIIPGEICCALNLINATKEKKHSIQDCGYQSEINFTNPQDRTLSRFGEFPWSVMIFNHNRMYLCAGSLIHPKVVLTTAYCLKNDIVFIVRAGEWNMSTTSEPYAHQNIQSNFVIKHPRFIEKNLVYNVALLVLEQPFNLDLNVKTICLSHEYDYQGQNLYSACVGTGWGTDSLGGLYHRTMKKVEYSLMSHTMCESKFRRSHLGTLFQLHRSFVCAINDEKLDLCTGDGGGPLVCPIETKPLRFQQVGITSWGLSCDGEFPSVFTDISFVKNWIDAQFNAYNLSTRYYTP